MSKNSVTHQKKVEHAVRKILNRWTGGVGVTRGNATTSRMRDGDLQRDGDGHWPVMDGGQQQIDGEDSTGRRN
jgi:hypothetical protein